MKKTKAQTDAEFIAKISTINISTGSGKEMLCPACGEHPVTCLGEVEIQIRQERPRDDEQSFSA
jgi:hypothetical protein